MYNNRIQLCLVHFPNVIYFGMKLFKCTTSHCWLKTACGVTKCLRGSAQIRLTDLYSRCWVPDSTGSYDDLIVLSWPASLWTPPPPQNRTAPGQPMMCSVPLARALQPSGQAPRSNAGYLRWERLAPLQVKLAQCELYTVQFLNTVKCRAVKVAYQNKNKKAIWELCKLSSLFLCRTALTAANQSLFSEGAGRRTLIRHNQIDMKNNNIISKHFEDMLAQLTFWQIHSLTNMQQEGWHKAHLCVQ